MTFEAETTESEAVEPVLRDCVLPPRSRRRVKRKVMSEDNLEQRELSDGDYVELPKWLSHGQMKAVQRTIVQSRKNDQEMDIQTDLIAMLVKNWSLKDADGAALPINKAGIEKAPQTKINEVFGEVTRLIELTTPNS